MRPNVARGDIFGHSDRRSTLRHKTALLSLTALLALPLAGNSQENKPQEKQEKKVGYDDTPMQPNGKWRVHDGKRPFPRVVTPGAFSSAKQPGKPPSDAIVLLGPGDDTSKWQMKDGGGAVTWKMKGGVLESGKGYVRTKDEWSDFQLHVEFATPTVVKGDGQGRGNSGVFLLDKFEVQVLDSYQNPTYPDGQAASMYGQFPPLVNASLKPGEWQVYDIVFTAPRFKDGKLEKPAVVTVLHNGVVVHAANQYLGPTSHKKIGEYTPDTVKGPIALQDHGNPVRYRNIWIRPLKGYDE
jgi:hypothetical protein